VQIKDLVNPNPYNKVSIIDILHGEALENIGSPLSGNQVFSKKYFDQYFFLSAWVNLNGENC
jgi:hypothetical protein